MKTYSSDEALSQIVAYAMLLANNNLPTSQKALDKIKKDIENLSQFVDLRIYEKACTLHDDFVEMQFEGERSKYERD